MQSERGSSSVRYLAVRMILAAISPLFATSNVFSLSIMIKNAFNGDSAAYVVEDAGFQQYYSNQGPQI